MSIKIIDGRLYDTAKAARVAACTTVMGFIGPRAAVRVRELYRTTKGNYFFHTYDPHTENGAWQVIPTTAGEAKAFAGANLPLGEFQKWFPDEPIEEA